MISPSCTAPNLSEKGYLTFNRVVFRDDQGGDERNLSPLNSEAFQDFARRYQDRYGGSPLDVGDTGVFAAYAYDATVILVQAIEQVAVVDADGSMVIGRQALAEAVRATPAYPGITGVISFSEVGDRVP
jgi:ABC-type branched-subunit amino acid transport system substrate-binding protein